MAATPEPSPKNGTPNGPAKYKDAQEAARIYFLPNLFTAGNLFFGFVAMILCIRARFLTTSLDTSAMMTAIQELKLMEEIKGLYTQAVECILAAAFCDALDGRLARLGGRESLFGKEFDSIADTVSFGVAPALMVFFLILSPDSENYSILFRNIGWIVGFIYLLCVAVRLARFNVLTNPLLPGIPSDASTKDFMGLPSPAAAGFVASLVLVMLNLDLRQWAILLLPLLLLVAVLMVSNIPYPSFKHIGWQTRTQARTFIFLVVGLVVAASFREYSFAIFFLCYIFYGLGRHIRRSWRKSHGLPPIDAPNTPDEIIPEEEDSF